jgi:hypothetical protein
MDKIKEHKAQYYTDNKNKFVQYRADNKANVKQYRDDNKANMKKYYEDNKNKIVARMQMKFDCKCGGKYTYNNKGGHVKSERHQKYLM